MEPYVIIGPGLVVCGQMFELKRSFEGTGHGDEFQSVLAAHAQGFGPGLNFQRERSGDKSHVRALGIGRDAIAQELLDWCVGDPGAQLFTHLWIMFQGFNAAGAADAPGAGLGSMPTSFVMHFHQ